MNKKNLDWLNAYTSKRRRANIIGFYACMLALIIIILIPSVLFDINFMWFNLLLLPFLIPSLIGNSKYKSFTLNGIENLSIFEIDSNQYSYAIGFKFFFKKVPLVYFYDKEEATLIKSYKNKLLTLENYAEKFFLKVYPKPID